MRSYHLFFVGALSLLSLVACQEDKRPITPCNLRVEYLESPDGITEQQPRFTWEYAGERNNFQISKYLLRIGTDPDHLETYQENYRWQSYTRYYWDVQVWDQKGNPCEPSAVSTFRTGKMDITDWQASWITDRHDKEYEPAPMFRKSFTLAKKVKEAYVYISAAGYYNLYVNGERIGDEYLNPGYTHFDKRNLFLTHNVTKYLQEGENVLATVLGNGWFNIQSVAVWDFEKARWRNRPRMICELRINYEDGTSEVMGSDQSWRTTTGPYTYDNLYSGDRYDATKEEEGWKKPGFNDQHWKNALQVEAPSTQLVAQSMPGIQIVERYKPIHLEKFSDKLYVYSFPKNFSGLCELKVKGKRGTHITIKHGELLKEDGRLEQGNINVYYRPVKPGEVFQMDEYTLKGSGEEECFMPSFSYHGFQYVEIESSEPIELEKNSLTGLFMHNALQPVGTFACSNPMLNKIWDATMQSYQSNLHNIPTDCPQREKNGWTADAHVSVDLGLLGFDGITFYEKWMNDFIDNQRDSTGQISRIIPTDTWGYTTDVQPVWDAALFIIPDALYNYYGDATCIERLYPTMQRYLEDYLRQREQDGCFLTEGLGDWVYWKTITDNTFTSTAYYYYDYKLMAKFARILGKDDTPYEQKAEELKSLINKRFYHTDTHIYAADAELTGATQAAQAVALYLGIVPKGEEQAVADKLCEMIRANNHFLDFGLLGSKTVPAMMTKYGYIEDFMQMLTKTEAPSWGYWVETMGSTTLLETWIMSPKFKDASLNHVFMGDVSAWMVNQLAGINYDTNQVGFQHILITPHFVEGLDWAEASYHSVNGLIESRWERSGEKVVLTVRIPGNCTAEIRVADRVIKKGSGVHRMEF